MTLTIQDLGVLGQALDALERSSMRELRRIAIG